MCHGPFGVTGGAVRRPPGSSLGEARRVEQSLQVGRICRRDAAAYCSLRTRSVEGLLQPAEPEVLRELGAGFAGMARMLDCYDIEGTRVWGVFQADVLAGAVSLSRHFHLQRLDVARSEEHTSELQSLMRISYAGFCLKKKN